MPFKDGFIHSDSPSFEEKIDLLIKYWGLGLTKRDGKNVMLNKRCGTCIDGDKDCRTNAGHVVCERWR